MPFLALAALIDTLSPSPTALPNYPPYPAVLPERLAEIHETIERMDFRWDHGFITDERDYVDKRLKLQQELEQLAPIPDDDLERAADLLENFAEHWREREGDPEAQADLVKLIVERVYVQDDAVVAMTLRSNYHIVLGHNMNGPTEAPVDPFLYTHGSDGIRIIVGLPVWFVPSSLYLGWLAADYHTTDNPIFAQTDGPGQESKSMLAFSGGKHYG